MRVQGYCDPNNDNKELTIRPVIAVYPTHRIPLMYVEEYEKYFLGSYCNIINGKRADIYVIANSDLAIGVKNAKLIWDPDEIDYGDAYDEIYKLRSIAWDWDNHCPVIRHDIKYGNWHVYKISGDMKDIEDFAKAYTGQYINHSFVFGEYYNVSMYEVFDKFPNLMFTGYYHVDTTNHDPHDYYQAIVWDSKRIIKIGTLFEIDDGWHNYLPVFDESGVVIKEMVMVPNDTYDRP